MSTISLGDIVSYLTGKGLSQDNSAAIAGNIYSESSGNPNAVNGSHYGLAQWDSTRQAAFQAQYGFPIQQATAAQQLDFLVSELSGKYSSTMSAMNSASTLQAKTAAFMNGFEKPGDNSLGSRVTNALNSLRSFMNTPIGPTPIGPDLGIANSVAGATAANPNPLNIPSLSSLLPRALASRSVAVILGVILIGLAIAAFVLKSPSVTTLVPAGAA